MKKLTVILGLVLLMCLLVPVSCAPSRPAGPPELPVTPPTLPEPTPYSTDWEVYRNDKYGFEIQYPPQYSVKEVEEKSAISFWPTKKSPYLVIWVLNNPKNYTLEEFYNFYSLPENKEISEEEVGKTVYNYYESPDSIEPMEINGISAVKFIVGGQWRMTISIPYEGKIFEIHAQPSAAKEKTFNQMLSTFKFTK